ncbi:MAG: DUF4139 domain-containing protein [Alphaproteobacteria bacterium]|nr:DUF4139 domain-containing protein [Alphaproteobacteria bacterium]MBU1572951.1 DUF4139 domain-containing protein [Alphaproteobacteria bacterium]MBU2077841.1 DUF4139 domain-containing protein [Alphaproteobacteria bacterium]MBU2161555.1 DUF4139 domain-containing protein [Alphaproteobacteria bacterium]MBU2242734.1 DUF4139 domain-containing protein [Alphaproteobacteria bacterium]
MFSNPIAKQSIWTTSALVLCAMTVPGMSLADSFSAQSDVTEVTLYPQSATVTREGQISLPAGQHEVTFTDIPASSVDGIIASLQSTVTGAALGPVTYARTATIGDAERYRTPEAKAAKAALDALEAQLRDETRKAAAVRLEVAAAEDTLAYLGRLSAGEATSVDTMAATADMIREHSLSARLAMADATARAEAADRDLEALKDNIARAKAALDRLAPSEGDRLSITLALDVAEAGDVTVDFSYSVDDAYWRPMYTARLNTETGALDLTRAVQATQETGENWQNVMLRFATDNPARRSDPNEVYPWVRRIYEPQPVQELMRSADADMAGYAESVMAAPMAMDKQMATANLTGLSLTYSYPTPATLYSNEGMSEFALSEVALTPELMVRAVPLFEDTGYLMAHFTNDTGEMLVPGSVRLIRDGVSLGETRLDTVVDGAEVDLAFGVVDGIRVTRTVLAKNEGDRGVISKSNEMSSDVRISVENLTAKSWPMEVIDRVSVSEQEDLKVDWSATPMPDVTNLDDKRGVMAWHFDLEAGKTQDITLKESLRWPEGMALE